MPVRNWFLNGGWMGYFTYLELGRGTATSFSLDFVDIADSDELRDGF
jgi:hypothetical protein